MTRKKKGIRKREWALRLFPHSSPHVAVNHLMAWIERCPPLMKALQNAGYHKRSKYFSPEQKELISDYLCLDD